MGIGVILAGISTAVGVASLVTTVSAQNRASNLQEQANQQQQEANQVSLANQEYQNTLARRQAAKEMRLRIARVANTSAAEGTSESSGAYGANSDIAATYGSGIAKQSADVLTASDLTTLKQNATDYLSNADNALQRAANFRGYASLFADNQNNIAKIAKAFY